MPKSSKAAPDAGLREQIFTLMRAAHEGRAGLEWFQQLATRAGWARVAGVNGEALALVTAAGLSAGMEIPEKTLRTKIAAGLPVYKHGLGNKGSLFDVFAVVKWLRGQEGVPEGSPDGSDSAALERYRTAKAIEAERKNKIEEGKLIPAEEVRNQRRAIAHVLRASLEIMVRTRPEMEAELRTAFEAASKHVDVVEVAES